jgi:hypothetical protein
MIGVRSKVQKSVQSRSYLCVLQGEGRLRSRQIPTDDLGAYHMKKSNRTNRLYIGRYVQEYPTKASAGQLSGETSPFRSTSSFVIGPNLRTRRLLTLLEVRVRESNG